MEEEARIVKATTDLIWQVAASEERKVREESDRRLLEFYEKMKGKLEEINKNIATAFELEEEFQNYTKNLNIILTGKDLHNHSD